MTSHNSIGAPDWAGTDAATGWHRAFVLGKPCPSMSATGVEAELIVIGARGACDRSAGDLVDRVLTVARLLGATGERLRAGDAIITGGIVQVAIWSGDDVVADSGRLAARG